MIGEVGSNEACPESRYDPCKADPIPPFWELPLRVSAWAGVFFSFTTVFLANRRRMVLTSVGGSGNGIQPQPQAMIELMDPSAPPTPYEQLSCSDQDRSTAYQVIRPLNGNFTDLLARRSELETLGNQLRGRLHPLKFLEIIFTHPELYATIKEVFQGSLWFASQRQQGFADGFGEGIALFKTPHCDRVTCYIEPFSRAISVRTPNLRPYFSRSDWMGLMNYLCETVPAPTGERSPELRV